MGIEALSRGASKAVFVDNSTKAVKCEGENIRAAKFERSAQILSRDSFDYIRLTAETFDIIILDPPYRKRHIAEVLPLAAKKLNKCGSIICEYESEMYEPQAPE